MKCTTCSNTAVIWSEGGERCQACYDAIVARRNRINAAKDAELAACPATSDVPDSMEFVPDFAAARDEYTVYADDVQRGELAAQRQYNQR